MLILISVIQYGSQSLNHGNKIRKHKKDENEMKKSNYALLPDGVILYSKAKYNLPESFQIW